MDLGLPDVLLHVLDEIFVHTICFFSESTQGPIVICLTYASLMPPKEMDSQSLASASLISAYT